MIKEGVIGLISERPVERKREDSASEKVSIYLKAKVKNDSD